MHGDLVILVISYLHWIQCGKLISTEKLWQANSLGDLWHTICHGEIPACYKPRRLHINSHGRTLHDSSHGHIVTLVLAMEILLNVTTNECHAPAMWHCDITYHWDMQHVIRQNYQAIGNCCQHHHSSFLPSLYWYKPQMSHLRRVALLWSKQKILTLTQWYFAWLTTIIL